MQSSTTTNLSSTSARGYAVALLSAVILSTTAIFIRYLMNVYQLPALILAFWRDLLTTVFLFLILYLVKRTLVRVSSPDLRYLVFYGLVLALFNSFWTISVAQNGAAIGTVLAYSSAAFTTLLGWWLLHEQLSLVKVIAVIFSISGCVLVAEALDPAAWVANPIGILTGIISGLCYAVYSLMGRSASQRGLNTWSILLYTFGFASVFLLVFNLIPGGFIPGAAKNPGELTWLGSSLAGWGVLLLLAAGPTLAGFGLYNVSLSLLPSSVANLILTLEPAFTATMAYIFLGENLRMIQIIGSLLIITGVVFLRLSERSRGR
jgi:drug/metabolite transporter (DMT)-like permease